MHVLWELLFWLALVGITYTYVGYGLLMTLLARWRARPVQQREITPTVTMLIAAYNEEDCIAAKIENALTLDYPADKIDLLVVTDGSTDSTNAIVAGYAQRHVRLLYQPQRRGKSAALIRAFPQAQGDVVVFSDANSLFAPGALRALVRNLADPQVAAASGAKRMLDPRQATGQGEGLYWRYEAYLKACDSAVSSVMGVPGEIWAVRRALYIPPDEDTLLDDFVASLRLVATGWRVVFDPQAVAYEEASPSLRAEWERRTRNAAGGWQAFFQLPEMLRQREWLLTVQYLSHRIARWMVTPALFVLLFLANLALLTRPLYAPFLAAQLVFYALAGVGWALACYGRKARWLALPFYVCLLNAAALVGGWRYLRRRQSVVWRKVR
jgi:poly-beta-1,6-N-acetyl-D-glucosamine synthase